MRRADAREEVSTTIVRFKIRHYSLSFFDSALAN